MFSSTEEKKVPMFFHSVLIIIDFIQNKLYIRITRAYLLYTLNMFKCTRHF